jgi:16S rRNA (uracil1498-N3)-methyltransferase
MALRRIFVESINGSSASVRGQAAHHLSRVVRLRKGERVELSDGSNVYLAEVRRRTADEVHFAIVEQFSSPQQSRPVTLQLAIFKFARLEWVIEKATELGVEKIVPVAANRSDPALVHAAHKRVERWRRIAEEAAQQCRRVAPPEIAEPIRFSDALAREPATLRLFLDTESSPLGQALSANAQSDSPLNAATLMVGPEGGWIESELRQAIDAGYRPVSLGDLVLRAETAAIAALAITSHLILSPASRHDESEPESQTA